MEATYRTVDTAGIAGRGGATMVEIDGEGLVFGGADRTGGLYGDLTAVRLAESGSPASSSSHRLTRVNGTGEGVDARSGLRIPAIGGHAAASVTFPCGHPSSRMLAFGGIDFVAGKVCSLLTEYTPPPPAPIAHTCGAWRALGAAPSGPPGAGGGGAAPSLGVPSCVGGEAWPGARTGHSMCTVPPPRVLHVQSEGGGGRGAPQPLSSVLGYAGSASALHTGVVLLFGGSSPEEGPLNDVWALNCTAPSSSSAEEGGEGAGEWRYSWGEVECGGSVPTPKELHGAWVRPALVTTVGGGGEVRGDTPVLLLQPPALCAYGGRGRENEGAPTNHLSVLTLTPRPGGGLTGEWLGTVACNTGGHAAGAACPTPSGLHFLVFGGQATSGDLTGDVWLCDARQGGGGGSITPKAWPWTQLALRPAPGQEEEVEGLAVRFAACASCLPSTAASERSGPLTLAVFGGMTVLEDTSQTVLLRLPADVR